MNKHINIHNIKETKIVIYLDQIYKIYDKNFLKWNKLVMPIKNDDTLEFYVCHQEKAIMNIEEYN